jgi:carbonic anhydrase
MNVSESRRVHSLTAPVAAENFGGDAPARGRADDARRAAEEHSSLQPLDCFFVGCSDYPAAGDSIFSPSSKIIFHDNIANLVAATDFSCLSALQYAVEVCRVKSVVVGGHHGCRGVAAIENRQSDVLSSWLRPVNKIAAKYKFLLEQIAVASDRLDALCELNVIEQVHAACRTTVVQSAWINGCKLSASGLIYDSQNRLLEGFQFSIGGNDSLPTKQSAAIEALARRWNVRLES